MLKRSNIPEKTKNYKNKTTNSGKSFMTLRFCNLFVHMSANKMISGVCSGGLVFGNKVSTNPFNNSELRNQKLSHHAYDVTHCRAFCWVNTHLSLAVPLKTNIERLLKHSIII